MDLKNNKMKHGGGASAMAAEHVTAMKKSLGSITASNSAKNTEPLRIGLKDLNDSEKKGKWWLIGASWRDPAKMASENTASVVKSTTTATGEEAHEKSTSNNLASLARAQGMNTDVRRAIFFALLDSVSFTHAHERVLKLNLKNKQMLEVPRVILRCASAEKEYNHFYTLVAAEFCKEHRLRKAWEFSLLDVFRRMGEDADDEEDESDEVDEKERLSVREAYNLARLYGSLVADGLLRLTVLKALDFSRAEGLQPTTSAFVQVLLSTAILALRSKARKATTSTKADEREGLFEAEVKAMFSHTHAVPNLALGLRYYFSRSFTKTDIAAITKGKKERDAVLQGVRHAVEALEDGDKGRADLPETLDSDEDSESGGMSISF
jgi:nucleolar MIF4G domain-containing protein 1